MSRPPSGALAALYRRHRTGPGESRWPASLATLTAIALYIILPERLIVGPRWVLPLLEFALVLPLTLSAPRRAGTEARVARVASMLLIAVVNLANVGTLVLLVNYLMNGKPANGRELVLAALAIWFTNVIVFGLWYWELDGGGPAERDRSGTAGRDRGGARAPAFLFPQGNAPTLAPKGWRPEFVDYLYVSFTNATAFSPTDTMPLTRWAKLLMGLQAMASLITVALVAARAVNILGA